MDVLADIDVESEDDDDDDEVVGGSTRPMTSRQAVLASVVDSSHVSLCWSPGSCIDPKTHVHYSGILTQEKTTHRIRDRAETRRNCAQAQEPDGKETRRRKGAL